MVWNSLGLPAVLSLILSLGMGALVFGTRPNAVENRRLALLLFVEGVVIFTLHGGAFLLTRHSAVYAFTAIGTIAVAIKPAVYLYFLSALSSPLTRPLQTRAARAALVIFALGGATLWFVMPQAFLSDVVRADHARWQALPGFLLRPLALTLAVIYLFGLAIAVSAFRNARTLNERTRTRAYAIAFGTRDVLFVIWATAFLIVPVQAPSWPLVFVSIAFMPLVYIPLVAYGILKAQLFGIDLHIKIAVKHGTIAAALAVIFIIVSELMEQLLPFNAPLLALGLAAAIALALRPVERVAQRLADRAFPGVADTAEYRQLRGQDIYRSTIESLLLDGQLSGADRVVLEKLQRNLRVAPEHAADIELQVTRALTARPAAADRQVLNGAR